MLLEKRIVGTELGIRGLTDFHEDVKNSLRALKKQKYMIVNIEYSRDLCGCTKWCSVIRHSAKISYQTTP